MKLRLAETAILFLATEGLIQFANAGGGVRSAPNENPNYFQAAEPRDLDLQKTRGKARALKRPGLSIFVADTVVNNTDPSLRKSGAFGDGEISIAVDPKNTNRIVITAVSDGPDATVLIWLSTDGGVAWTHELTINSPQASGVPGFPCDPAADFCGFHGLTGAFLTAPIANIASVTSSELAGPSDAYHYFNLQGFVQPVNHFAGLKDEEQPWLLTGRSASAAGSLKNVAAAHDDFSAAQAMWVTAETGSRKFTINNHRTGVSAGVVNLGYRLANDPHSGALYSLFQRWNNAGAGDSRNIDYMLNRSTDGGKTWELNGSPEGIVVANADSTQPQPKFCTVNALLGGADQAAVDPQTGDVYYVYGNRDPATGNNRLAMRRLSGDKHGGLATGPEVFVTGQGQAALPSMAIASNETIGVFYYMCDGVSLDGFPILSAHFSVSTDQGNSFIDNTLETFLSPATDDGDPRQRVLGDYMQMKAVGNTFFGGFIGNGEPFKPSISSNHPIFYKVSVGRPVGVAR